MSEARATFLALVKVLLHDTTNDVVPAPVGKHLRRAVDRFIPLPLETTNLGSLDVVRSIHDRV
jgi:hypothetical protein